jgi:Zn-dependent protease
LPNFDIAQVIIAFTVLLVSLTVHEMAHAWSADRLGDPTARLLGRITLNPVAHADPIGTVLFPLIALVTGAPLIGWAKPVPVDVRRLPNQYRDFVLVAAAGPASNIILAVGSALIVMAAPLPPPLGTFFERIAVFNMLPIPPLDGGNVLSGLLPRHLGRVFDQIRPFGFLILYAVILTDAFRYLVARPSNFLINLLLPL